MSHRLIIASVPLSNLQLILAFEVGYWYSGYVDMNSRPDICEN